MELAWVIAGVSSSVQVRLQAGTMRIPNTKQFTLLWFYLYCTKHQFRGEVDMETNEWIARCSARLHAQWPRLQREQRDEVAMDLWHDQRWQQSEPEVAVVEWLSQGIPVPVGSQQ